MITTDKSTHSKRITSPVCLFNIWIYPSQTFRRLRYLTNSRRITSTTRTESLLENADQTKDSISMTFLPSISKSNIYCHRIISLSPKSRIQTCTESISPLRNSAKRKSLNNLSKVQNSIESSAPNLPNSTFKTSTSILSKKEYKGPCQKSKTKTGGK